MAEESLQAATLAKLGAEVVPDEPGQGFYQMTTRELNPEGTLQSTSFTKIPAIDAKNLNLVLEAMAGPVRALRCGSRGMCQVSLNPDLIDRTQTEATKNIQHQIFPTAVNGQYELSTVRQNISVGLDGLTHVDRNQTLIIDTLTRGGQRLLVTIAHIKSE